VAKSARRFTGKTLAALQDEHYLRVRAGSEPHKFIGIWMVVVDGRVFVRSWSLKPRSWWRTFAKERRGAISIDGREIPVRALQTRSERIKDAVSKAYAEKYITPASVKYVRDMSRKNSRDTTTELMPL
jgi:hypothetical protein